MGKGKGAVRNWYFRIKNGWPVFFFKNWNSSILRFGIRKLKIFLPGKWIFYYNDNSMLFNSSRSINRNNLWIL
jgi:ribosomal protein L16/L10AE